MTAVWMNDAQDHLAVVVASAVDEHQSFTITMDISDYSATVASTVELYALDLPTGPSRYIGTVDSSKVVLNVMLPSRGVSGYEIALF